MTSNKEKYVFLIILLLTLGAGFLVFYFKDTTPAGLHYAFPGRLVAGFPSELVLDQEATVKKSYSIDNAASASQKTTVFSSDKSDQELFVLCGKYFKKADWRVFNIVAKEESLELYARKDSDELKIVISRGDGKNKKNQLIVSYFTKN